MYVCTLLLCFCFSAAKPPPPSGRDNLSYVKYCMYNTYIHTYGYIYICIVHTYLRCEKDFLPFGSKRLKVRTLCSFLFFSSLLLFSYCIAYFFPPQEGFEALQPSNARRRSPNPNLPRPLTAHHQPLLKPKFYN